MIPYELSTITFNRSPPTAGQANLFWDHEGVDKEKSFAKSGQKRKNERQSRTPDLQEAYI